MYRMYIVYIMYIVYTFDMSKGISKFQLALSIAKGKRIELVLLQEEYVKRWKLHAGRKGLDVSKPPKTIYADMIVERIKQLDLEILDIEGRVPRETDNRRV